MANGSGLRQHQEMARGGEAKSGGSFGCESLSSMNGGPNQMGGHSEESAKYGGQSRLLSDSERAGPPHIGRGAGQMPAMAHSDHGPHGA